MDKQELKARQNFFAATGKTPEEEAKDSAHALGIVVVIVPVVVVAAVLAAIFA